MLIDKQYIQNATTYCQNFSAEDNGTADKLNGKLALLGSFRDDSLNTCFPVELESWAVELLSMKDEFFKHASEFQDFSQDAQGNVLLKDLNR